MDEQHTTTNAPFTPIMPPPVAPAPAAPPKQSLLGDIPPWLIGGIAVAGGIIILFGIRQMTQKPSPPAGGPTPTPSITSAPTPIRERSPFATTSAFMTLDNAVASYAASVKAYNASDPSLSPPVLDLNLGF